MRSSARASLAAAVALTAVVSMTGVADADKHHVLPTRSQVQAARDAVARKAGDVASIRAQLVIAESRLEAAAAQAEVAAEQYNGAVWRLHQATAAAAAAAQAAVAAGKKVEDERAGIAALATESFENGGELSGITAFLGSGGPTDIADRITVTQGVAQTLQDRFNSYAASQALADGARRTADKAKRDQAALTRKAAGARNRAAAAANAAQASARSIAVQRRQLIDELAAAQQISVALATQRQQGLEQIAAEKAAKAAAARAAAQAAADAAAAIAEAQQAGNTSVSGSAVGGAPSVSTRGAAGRAIAFAEAQLGEPYVWAAAGPDAWDCSGLTMKAWNAGGVSLPHYSAAQYAQIQHITVNDLRPGDLVFWGDSPETIHHVAMYIGNGQIIHAPRTGRPVSINPMYYWIPPNYFGRP